MKMDSARWVILALNVKELNLLVTSKRTMILSPRIVSPVAQNGEVEAQEEIVQ